MDSNNDYDYQSCIICGKAKRTFNESEFLASWTPTEHENTEISTFLKLIDRYFVGSSGGKLSANNNEFLGQHVSCYSVCIKCHGILVSVNQLYQELECLQMKINWKIATLQKIVECAAESNLMVSGEEIKQFGLEEDMVKVESNQKGIKGLSKFRSEFVHTCSAHLNGVLPKVIISRCNDKRDRGDADDNLFAESPAEPEHIPDPDDDVFSSDRDDGVRLWSPITFCVDVDPSDIDPNLTMIPTRVNAEPVEEPEQDTNLPHFQKNVIPQETVLDIDIDIIERLNTNDCDHLSNLMTSSPSGSTTTPPGDHQQVVNMTVCKNKENPLEGENDYQAHADNRKIETYPTEIIPLQQDMGCETVQEEVDSFPAMVTSSDDSPTTIHVEVETAIGTNHPPARSLRHRLECSLCKQTFTNVSRLEAHTKTHEEEKNSEYFSSDEDNLSVSSHDELNDGGTGETCFDSDSTDDEHITKSTCEIVSRKRKVTDHLEKIQEDVKIHPISASSSSKSTVKRMKPKIQPSKQGRKEFVITGNGVTIHNWVNKVGAKYKCGVEHCGKKFMTSDCLKDHSNLHGTFPCNFCSEIKNFATDLASHELDEHSSEKRKCPRCSYKFSKGYSDEANNEKYLNHFVHVHLERLVDGVRCPVCKAFFVSYIKQDTTRNLFDHYIIRHKISQLNNTDEEEHKCLEEGCSAYFLTAYQLEKHKTKFHVPGQYKCICKECGWKFKTKRLMYAHRRKKHFTNLVENLSFACKVPGCGTVWETELDLELHAKGSHRGKDSLIPCTHCGKGYGSKSSLWLHMKTHDDKLQKAIVEKRNLKRPVCDQCGKSCRDKHRLQIHMQHHLGPESWTFSCSVCSKKCLNTNKLNEHMRTHSKARPFICQVCGGSYAHPHNLRSHMERMHGDKKPEPFVCQVCGVTYAFKHNLRNHVKAKHGGPSADVN